MRNDIPRREFLKTSAAVAGGMAIGLGGNFVARAADEETIKKTRSYNGDMQYRRLGKTGIWVSSVCMGGHWKRVGEVTKHNIPAVSLPKGADNMAVLRKNRSDVLTRCMEVGINYIDACTEAEISVYGPALKGRRDSMYMGFAMWPNCPRNAKYRTADALLKKLEEGLKRAEVDYVDVWRLVASTPGRHSPGDEEEFIKAFEKAKEQGKARFTGVSSHGRQWLKRLAENYPEHFQVLLFPYTAGTKELPKDSLFDAVRKHDVGTFGIKPFSSNSLFQRAKSAEEKDKLARMTLRHILGNPAITAPIPGLACVEEVDNAAAAVKELALNVSEARELETASKDMWANLSPGYEWLKDWEYV
ncbi:MAG: aldo/keto reductase [Kiritimatiellia bacterium]|jgi:aryl-alcohol dehydrogenase-like predicted oxidoreductase|nr:aldo/keto reductase [Kiritimatiellia bacterium]MDP6848986.1 aldo/keto reductase [Kiritimatiellia bacterium]